MLKRIYKRRIQKVIATLLLTSNLIGLTPIYANETQDFKGLSTSETLNSLSMEEAFPVYEEAIKTLEFHQLGSSEWTGASLEEVKESVKAEVEPYEVSIDGALDFKMLLYPYGTAALDSAEIGFLFAEDHLIFVALGNLMVSMDSENLLDEEVAEALSQEGVTLEEISQENVKVKAFGHVSVDGQGRDMLAIDVGEEAANAATYFYFIENGEVIKAESLDLFSAMQGTQTIMFDKLALHYANGEIGPASAEAMSNSLESLVVESELEVDPLKKLMTGTTITNPKYVEAWQAYQQVLAELSFRDLASEELIGSKIDDVEKTFDVGIEARRVDFPDSPVSLLVYTYEDTEINPATGQADIGEMALYFVDELLAYTSVASRSFVIEAERLLSEEDIKALVSDQATVDELADLNPQVVAMGYMYQNEEPRSIVALQSGDSEDSRQVSFVFIRNDAIRGSETYALEEVMQDVQSNMFFSLGDFFVNEANQLNE